MTAQQTELEARVARLEGQVTELSAALATLQRAAPSALVQSTEPPAKLAAALGQDSSEELLSWVDKAYILPRMATTSFILVVALALRTLTDGGVIDVQLGTLLGMVYAFMLIAYGWFAYGQRGAQAPVFVLWGTIVMCAVVVETHRVFQALPTVVAYLLLAMTGWTTVLMSRRYRVALPVFAGTIGMSFGAFAINYPSPVFPLLVVIMVLANGFSAYASGLLRASWLRWVLLVLTLFMVQIWALKLGIYLGKLSAADLDFSLQGFFPALAGVGTAFAAIALWGVLGKIQSKVSKFDIALPVINVLWIVIAARHVLAHGLVAPWVFGVPAVLAGAGHLWIAWWLARRDEAGGRGVSVFALAGGLLIAFSLPLATGDALLAATAIAALAVGLAWAAQRLAHGGIRLVSYLLQGHAAASLVILLHATEQTEPSLLGAVASGLLAAIAAYHYLWSRNTAPPAAGGLIERLNRNDRCAALVLVAALLNGFFTLRTGLYQGLHALHMAAPAIFSSGQSLLINLIAATLLLVGLRRRSRELRNVGILITVVAAGKVFMDVISIKGMSLLLSIFSFGVVAAIASVVLGRWGKAAGAEKAAVTPDGGE